MVHSLYLGKAFFIHVIHHDNLIVKCSTGPSRAGRETDKDVRNITINILKCCRDPMKLLHMQSLNHRKTLNQQFRCTSKNKTHNVNHSCLIEATPIATLLRIHSECFAECWLTPGVANRLVETDTNVTQISFPSAVSMTTSVGCKGGPVQEVTFTNQRTVIAVENSSAGCPDASHTTDNNPKHATRTLLFAGATNSCTWTAV